MTSMPPTSATCRAIPGYEGDYYLCDDETVWSRKAGGWSRKDAWIEHGESTVELWRHGKRTRRRVVVLMRDVFGEESDDQDDEDLRWYLSEQYDLPEEEIEEILRGEDDL